MIRDVHKDGQRPPHPIHPAARARCCGRSRGRRGSPRSAPRLARRLLHDRPKRRPGAVEASELKGDRSFVGRLRLLRHPDPATEHPTARPFVVQGPAGQTGDHGLLATVTTNHLLPSERRPAIAGRTQILHPAPVAVSIKQGDRVGRMDGRADCQQQPRVPPVRQPRAEQGERVPLARPDPRRPA